MNTKPMYRWFVMVVCCLLASGAMGQVQRTFHPNGQLSEETPYVDGRIEGVQRHYFENGQLKDETPFVAGQYEGVAKSYYPSGVLGTEAPYSAHVRHGLVRNFYESGQVSEEIPYTHGTIEGVQRHYFENGQLKDETPFVAGQYEGVAKSYYPSGVLGTEAPYSAHVRHGLVRNFYESGQVSEEIPYTHGTIEGVQRHYFENGQLKDETPFVAGQYEGVAKSYYPSGVLGTEAPYSAHVRHGLVRNFYESGQVSEEIPYTHGTIEGVQRRYYDDGQLRDEILFVNSAPQGAARTFEHGSAQAVAGARAPQPSRATATTAVVAPSTSATTGSDVPSGDAVTLETTVDPDTGIATTVALAPDGTRVETQNELLTDEDGRMRMIEVDDQGNLSETVVADGATLTTEYDALGNATAIVSSADGEFVTAHASPDGITVTTVREESGLVTSTTTDAFGNVLEAQTRTPDGTETRASLDGTVLERAFAEDGTVTETTTDAAGNTSTVTRDSTGEVVAREAAAGPKQPGQQYFEGVLNGADWTNLTAEGKANFASAERRVRLETQPASIEAEQAAADARSAARIAREQRELDVAASYERAEQLEREYAEAVASGDMQAARRIQGEQDQHNDASMELLSLNAEEQAAMEHKQQLRDEIYARVVTRARAEADRLASEDWGQDLSESVTGVASLALVGATMQQETAASTRLANYEANLSRLKKESLQRELDDPNTTPEGREIIASMMDLADVQETGALEQLASNTRLTAAGYAIDAGLLLTGGIGNAGAALGSRALVRTVGKEAAERVIDIAARRGITEVASTGVLAATERLAGTQAAERLASVAATVAETGSGALARIAEAGGNAATRIVGEANVQRLGSAVSTTGRVLSTDVATGAQAESRLLTAMVSETVVGGITDAGTQLVTTGQVDTAQLVRNAIGGGIAGVGLSSLIDNIPRPGARPARPVTLTAPLGTAAPTASPASVASASSPASTAATPANAPPRARAATARPAALAAAPPAPAAAASNAPAPRLSQPPAAVATSASAPAAPRRANAPAPIVAGEAPTVVTQAPTVIDRQRNTAGSRTGLQNTALDAPVARPVEPPLADTRTLADDPGVTRVTNGGNLADTLRLPDDVAPSPAPSRRAPEPARLDSNRSADGFLRDEQARSSAAVLDADVEVGAAALERQRQLETAERAFQRLGGADKARMQEAWETFQRLRQNNPLLASLDEVDAFARLSEGAARSRGNAGSSNRYAPEEIIANFATSNGVAIGPAELSRAANVSLPNAEGAIAASLPYARNGQLPVYNPALDVPTPGARPRTQPSAPPAQAAGAVNAPVAVDPALEALQRRTDELFDFNRPVETPRDAPADALRDAPTLRDENGSPSDGDSLTRPPSVAGAAPQIADLPEGALRGHRTSLTRPDGSSVELVIGDFINQGSSNQIYRLDSAPGKVLRMSRGPSNSVQAQFDLAGRQAIQDIGPKLGGDLEFVSAEIFPDASSSTPGLNGRTFMIMDEVNVRAAEQLGNNAAGMPSTGQAIAYDRGLRALNRNGYAMLDGHPANFYFRKAGEPDEWVMVVIDAGGIVPARGGTDAARAANARKIQGLVDDPADRPPGDLSRRTAIDYVNKAIKMEGPLRQLVDETTLRKLGLERLEDLFTDEPLFRPSGAEDFPMVRGLFSTPDDAIETAYRALRELGD